MQNHQGPPLLDGDYPLAFQGAATTAATWRLNAFPAEKSETSTEEDEPGAIGSLRLLLDGQRAHKERFARQAGKTRVARELREERPLHRERIQSAVRRIGFAAGRSAKSSTV